MRPSSIRPASRARWDPNHRHLSSGSGIFFHGVADKGPRCLSVDLSLDGHRGVHAVLAEAEVGAQAAELFKQTAERRSVLDPRLKPRLPEGAVPLVYHLSCLRGIRVGSAIGTDGN